MSNKLPIKLRPANADDVGFIFNSWLKSFRNSALASNMPNEVYFSEHHKVIERILKFYDVIVACNPEDVSQIYGFICGGYTDNILTIHYAYVKHTFRKMGIMREMLNSFEHNPEYASVYTHQSKPAKAIADKYNFIYHPYIGLDPAAYNTDKQKEVYGDDA